MRFLVLGCQRSGTTLLRLWLNSHPEIYCWDELYGYKELELNNDANLKTLSGNKPKMVGFKVPVLTELMQEYDFANKFNYPVLFAKRSIYEVVASMLELPEFLNHAISDIRLWLTDSNRRNAKLFFSEEMISEVEKSNELVTNLGYKDGQVRLAASYWGYKNYVLAYMQQKMRVKVINYDELVTQLKPILSDGLAFLGLEWHDKCLQHHKLQHDETENNLAIGNTEVNRPVDNKSMSKYKHVLTPLQIQFLANFKEELRLKYGIDE